MQWMAYTFMPLVMFYHMISGNIFLNVAADDSCFTEHCGNVLLVPFQYLFAGQIATPTSDPKLPYQITQRFDYHDHLWLKTAGAVLALPITLPLGSAVKSLAYLNPEMRKRQEQIHLSLTAKETDSHKSLYDELGFHFSDEKIHSQGIERKAGDELHLSEEKLALKEISSLLKAQGIIFWADCGTCIGAYRHGGVIPWDEDIDIGILAPDFSNVKRALKSLDPDKYLVQDWSNRLFPETLLKVYVRSTRNYIDIYHFSIDKENRTLQFILSNKDNFFMSNDWVKSELVMTVPTGFDVIFPLKKADFDGIEIYVPNEIEKYLSLRYGENLSPSKIYDPQTGNYVKVASHPYWKLNLVK